MNCCLLCRDEHSPALHSSSRGTWWKWWPWFSGSWEARAMTSAIIIIMRSSRSEPHQRWQPAVDASCTLLPQCCDEYPSMSVSVPTLPRIIHFLLSSSTKLKILPHTFVRKEIWNFHIFSIHVLNLNEFKWLAMYARAHTLALLHAAKRAACSLVMDDAWGTVSAADPMISRPGTQHNHPRDACRIRSSSSGRNLAGIMSLLDDHLHCLGWSHAKIRPSPRSSSPRGKAWIPSGSRASSFSLPPSCPLMHSICFSTNHLNAQRAPWHSHFAPCSWRFFYSQTSIVTFTRHMNTHIYAIAPTWTWPHVNKNFILWK